MKLYKVFTSKEHIPVNIYFKNSRERVQKKFSFFLFTCIIGMFTLIGEQK